MSTRQELDAKLEDVGARADGLQRVVDELNREKNGVVLCFEEAVKLSGEKDREIVLLRARVREFENHFRATQGNPGERVG
jgi:hypothetical protein